MSQSNSSVTTNGNHRPLTLAIEDDPDQEQPTGAFYDASSPLLAPARPVDLAKRKGRKRKLLGVCLILLLILAGVAALYFVFRVNRVSVLVKADTPRDDPNKNSKTATSRNAENNLTEEAINLTRKAAGADSAAASPTNSPSPSVSPAAAPRTGSNERANYSATENSPAYGLTRDNSGSSTSGSSQNQSAVSTQSSSSSTSNVAPINEIAQSHANVTQTLFVEDLQTKPSSIARTLTGVQPASRDETKPRQPEHEKPAVLPPFGTMLPVRTQGVIFTQRNNSYARLELARDAAGPGWSLPKGTILIGRVSGGEYDRAFVGVNGYLDPRDNKFVKLTGEVLGSDGATGLQGKPVAINQDGLKRTMRKVASTGLQVAGMMAGALTGRGTVVIDRAGYRLMNPLTDEAGRAIGGGANDRRTFVKVEAGRAGYVMVADLPRTVQAVDAPGEDDLARAATSLTDREVMELILLGSPEEIRAALPLMNDEQKQQALKALTSEAKK